MLIGRVIQILKMDTISIYCVFFGPILISCSSKHQPIVSRSNAEAEYQAVANVVSKVLWLHSLLSELGHRLSSATLVLCDNVSAIFLAFYPVHSMRTKHVKIDLHFVHTKWQSGPLSAACFSSF